MPTRSLSAPALTLAALLAGSTTLGAVDIWVTRYDDPPPGVCLPTDCSLREAVIATRGSRLSIGSISPPAPTITGPAPTRTTR